MIKSAFCSYDQKEERLNAIQYQKMLFSKLLKQLWITIRIAPVLANMKLKVHWYEQNIEDNSDPILAELTFLEITMAENVDVGRGHIRGMIELERL